MTQVKYDYDKLFGSLNENQTEALKAPPDALLQVVAGPGTGKTKLLVAKVAYLLLHHRIPSSGIIVTTFTKKAANEMKERLQDLLKDYPGLELDKLQIGTFHRICLGYLRHYGKVIGIGNDFKIADPKDQKELMTQAINYVSSNSTKPISEEVKMLLSYVSKKKSLGQHPEEVTIENPALDYEVQNYHIYTKYHELMTKNSFLDFDDILVYTNKLLRERPQCAAHIKHILVDEFQDTNTIQLNLVFRLAKYCHNNVTIVGDADQSIYGWRNATYENFKNMELHAMNSSTQFIKVTLDQNYRSTEAILKVAEHVMRGQVDREQKSLISNTSEDTPVYYICHNSPYDEPVFIANEIKKVMKESKKGYAYRSFAVIVRASRTFLGIEKELSKRGIPYRIVKGHSFWELKEISMAVDSMRTTLLNDWLAYKRVIEWFCPGCGPKLLGNIENTIYNTQPYGNFVFDIVQKFAKGEISGASARARESLSKLLSAIEFCRSKLPMEAQGKEYIKTFYQEILKKFDIIELCMKKKTSTVKSEKQIRATVNENLGELMAQLNTYDPETDELLQKAQEEVFKEQDRIERETTGRVETEKSTELEVTEVTVTIKSESSFSTSESTPVVYSPLEFISLFLTHIHLAESISADDGPDTDTQLGKVTLTTIHGSKGLEWPVVFVPSLMNNILPTKFALIETNEMTQMNAMNEERRCLYVALTRARDRLYMSAYQDINGFGTDRSVFLNDIPTHLYHDLSPSTDALVEMAARRSDLVNFVPQRSYLAAQANREYEKWEQHRLRDQAESQERARNLPSRVTKPTKPSPVVGGTGISYNPVTGSVTGATTTEQNPHRPMPAKKRRLGMGKPLSQLLPRRK